MLYLTVYHCRETVTSAGEDIRVVTAGEGATEEAKGDQRFFKERRKQLGKMTQLSGALRMIPAALLRLLVASLLREAGDQLHDQSHDLSPAYDFIIGTSRLCVFGNLNQVLEPVSFLRGIS